MYIRIFSLFIMVFLFQFLLSWPAPVYAATNVEGDIFTDTTWDVGGSPYCVTGNIRVNPGATLIIEPGVVVKFTAGTTLYVLGTPDTMGTLNARGTADQPIYFTDYRDDSVGGDTNGDGAATTAEPGGWCHIYMYGGNAIMDYCIVRYGGGGNNWGNVSKSRTGTMTLTNSVLSNSNYAGLKIVDSESSNIIRGNVFSDNKIFGMMVFDSGADLIEDNVFESNHYGIWVKNSSPDIFQNTIIYNRIGIWCSEATPAISGSALNTNQIYNNSQYGVQNASESKTPPIIDAQYNWWGDPSGPYHYITNPDGTGDSVSDYVYFSNYLQSAEPCPGQVQFSSSIFTINENERNAVITVSRTGGSDGIVTVDYATGDGTAREGEDYTGAAGTLLFAHGEKSKTFTVTILDDAEVENDETVHLTLSSPGGGAILGLVDTAVISIIDNDDLDIKPEVTGSSASVTGIPVEIFIPPGAVMDKQGNKLEKGYAFTFTAVPAL